MSAVAVDISYYAKPERDGTLGLDLAIDGITCGACIGRIEGAVRQLPGIVDARLNYTNRRLHVAWTDGALTPARIVDALAEQGYRDCVERYSVGSVRDQWQQMYNRIMGDRAKPSSSPTSSPVT